MPTLSDNSLEKRFPCPNCGQSLRTRQGLSGHIQFKHPADEGSTSPYTQKLIDLIKKKVAWIKFAKSNNYPSEICEQGQELFRRWEILKGYFESINIELTQNDFKNYFMFNFGSNDPISKAELQLVKQSLDILAITFDRQK